MGIRVGAVILIASAAPPLVSVFPGRVVADASVRSPGDVVQLPASVHGGLRVLVSSACPRGRSWRSLFGKAGR